MNQAHRHYRNATLERRDLLRVLHVRGSSFERGLQQGMLLREEACKQTHSHYLNYLDRILDTSPLGRFPQHWRSRLRSFLGKDLLPRFVQPVLAQPLEERRGFAAGAEIDLKTLELFHIVPELLNAYVSLSSSSRGVTRMLPPVHTSDLGCTSLASWGKMNEQEHFLVGRSFDYLGTDVWDRAPTVTFHHPSDGQAYVCLSTAGLPTAGLTAINEAGLSIAIHLIAAKDFSQGGVPLFDLADKVARDARTLEEAASILARFYQNTGVTLVLTHGKERRAMVMELCGRRKVLRQVAKPPLVQTNHFLTPGMQDLRLDHATIRSASTLARYQRAKDLFGRHLGKINEQRMVDFLGDHYDPYFHRERAFGCILGQPHCLQSMVYNADTNILYVGSGKAPTHHSSLAAFDLNREFSRSFTDRDDTQPDPLKPTAWAGGMRMIACHAFLQAHRMVENGEDLRSVVPLLDEVVVEFPEDAIPRFLLGMILLKIGETTQALAHFREAAIRPDLAHRRCLYHLWMARTHDLLGQRKPALLRYKQALSQDGMVQQSLLDACAHGMRKRYKKHLLSKIRLDFLHGDLYSY